MSKHGWQSFNDPQYGTFEFRYTPGGVALRCTCYAKGPRGVVRRVRAFRPTLTEALDWADTHEHGQAASNRGIGG